MRVSVKPSLPQADHAALGLLRVAHAVAEGVAFGGLTLGLRHAEVLAGLREAHRAECLHGLNGCRLSARDSGGRGGSWCHFGTPNVGSIEDRQSAGCEQCQLYMHRRPRRSGRVCDGVSVELGGDAANQPAGVYERERRLPCRGRLQCWKAWRGSAGDAAGRLRQRREFDVDGTRIRHQQRARARATRES